jgi:hypothetical protein
MPVTCLSRRGGCGLAYACHGDRGVLGDDLLGRHAGGQAVQDHADRHPGSGRSRPGRASCPGTTRAYSRTGEACPTAMAICK